MLFDFPYNIQELCSFCYKKNKFYHFIEDKCVTCKSRNINPTYVRAENHKDFVRDFRNSGNTKRGTGVDSCLHEGIVDKYEHATKCSFAITDFEYHIWHWMVVNEKLKMSDIFTEYIAPYVFTSKNLYINKKVTFPIIRTKFLEKIHSIPESPEENSLLQQKEKKKIYFCWFCIRNITSVNDVEIHLNGGDHKLYYEADKKRRWYFKMPHSIKVVICKEEKCVCFSPHSIDEYCEMVARIKFRKFDFKKVSIQRKKVNPWPVNVDIVMPFFPNNIKCYKRPIRNTVKLNLHKWGLSYICTRDDSARPYYTLYHDLTNQSGQLLIFESNQPIDFENFNFDIEFSPQCSGSYIQVLEFGFMLRGNEYCSQKLFRVDVGSWPHLEFFVKNCRKYNPILKRDQQFENIIPFSLENKRAADILNVSNLRNVFRIVSNRTWMTSRPESWNYCHWMRDMIVHEELEQQLLLSKMIYKGNVKLSKTIENPIFIPAKSGQMFGIILFQNDPNSSVVRDFIVRNINNAFLLCRGLNNRKSLYECELVDDYRYRAESRSLNGVTLCFSETIITQLQLESKKEINNVTVIFRYSRVAFERRHKSLDRMPHFDELSYVPLCCPSFTRLPLGEDKSAVSFNPKLTLNDEQKMLPNLVLRHVKSNEIVLPFALNGAFGTGKTSVIAETVRTILMNGRPKCRILICTRSHSASFVYLDMFKDFLDKKKLDKVKVISSNPRKIAEKFKSLICETNNFGKEVFQENRVFISVLDTLSRFGVDSNLGNPTFEYVFVDEASQILEIDAITVYQFGNKESKFIFAGDVFQMRPQLYNESLKKFKVPIVSRLHEVYKRCPEYEICLKKVYRTHPNLVEYLSVAIYRGCGLSSGREPLYKDLVPMKFSDSNSDSNSGSKYCEQDCSFMNKTEAKMVVNAVVAFLETNQFIEPPTIIICTPFLSQKKLILKELDSKKVGILQNQSINVRSPTDIQGDQFDAVFISTVLTVNHKFPINEATFHSSKGMINLVISRAKHYVEVIGDSKSLLSNQCKEQWQIFINYCNKLHSS